MMDILFYIVPVLFVLVFAYILAMFLSPKFRGKMMSREIKATKHMLDYTKKDLEDLMATTASMGINSEKTILDEHEDTMRSNATRRANINKDGIEITTRAIKSGLANDIDKTNNTKYCHECGKKISLDAKYCSYCGKEQ